MNNKNKLLEGWREVEKRILEFDKKTRKIKEKISEEVFNKSLDDSIIKKINGEDI